MKLTLVIVTVTVLVYGVMSTSQPDCSLGCNTSYCPDISSCSCGTFADYCGCCQYCNACAGETCNMIAGQSCEDGYLCRPPEGYSFTDVATGRISSLCVRI